MNGDSKSTNVSGPSLVGSLGSSCRNKHFLLCFAALFVTLHCKIFFFSLCTISIPMSPSPSKLGMQPCWVACLLVCVSGLLTFKDALASTFYLRPPLYSLLCVCRIWSSHCCSVFYTMKAGMEVASPERYFLYR